MLIKKFIHGETHLYLYFSQGSSKSGDPYDFPTNWKKKKRIVYIIFKTHICFVRPFLQFGVLLEEVRKKEIRCSQSEILSGPVLFLSPFFCLVFTKVAHSASSWVHRTPHSSSFCELQCDSTIRRVTELFFICSAMPEEVTYATLNFPNISKAEKSQESCILKRTGKILYAGSDKPEKRLFTYTGGFSCLQLQTVRLF